MCSLTQFALFLALPIFLHSASIPDGDCPADVMLVVDGSDSISNDDFETILEALTSFADGLLSDGSSDKRMGVVVFGTRLGDIIHFTSNLDRLKTDIGKLRHPKDGTQTDEGIAEMIKQFNGNYGRDNVPRYGIVITDGDSKDKNKTKEEAENARKEGVTMFSVGIGNDIGMDELQGIASEDEYVFAIAKFEGLAASLKSLSSGWCITTTMPTTTNAPHWLCNNCTMRNGIGYSAHPYYCDKYVQCYYSDQEYLDHKVMQCSFNTVWDQQKLACVHAVDSTCDSDPCRRNPSPVSFQYSLVNSGYWMCKNGKMAAICCPKQMVYDPYRKDCVKKSWGVDDCPPKYTQPSCELYPDPDPHKFQIQEPGRATRTVMACAPGTKFSVRDCHCTIHTGYTPPKCSPELYISFENKNVYDQSGKHAYVENEGVVFHRIAGANGTAGYFNGKSRLLIPRFSNMDVKAKLLIRFSYKSMGSNRGVHSLITNGDCEKQATVNVLDNRNSNKVDFEVRESAGNTARVSVRKGANNGWQEVEFWHDQSTLTGTVTSVSSQQTPALGRYQDATCALQVGYWQPRSNFPFTSFTGYIDDLYVYHCYP